jgi:uncharacterized protein YegL
MPSNTTEIIVLLDRSGSMNSIKDDMIGGFNTFIDEQRAVPGECRVSLTQFGGTSVETVYEALEIRYVAPLVFSPHGLTPLFDAIAQTIDRVGARFAAMAESNRPARVLFLIITDGDNNNSKLFSLTDVKARIQHQTDVYKWTFSFIGACVDELQRRQRRRE